MLVRMALHTGNADERDGDYFGAPLNRCARLLSTGHGGQTLVSSVTAGLLGDSLGSMSLLDLGTHALRDLERPEHIFQVNHPDLLHEFPGLRSETPILEASACLAEGRQAHAAHDWERAYQAYQSALSTIQLSSEDQERLGDAAFWTGRERRGRLHS